MPTRTVIFDKVGYSKPRPSGDTRPGRLRASARRGDTITLDDREADRLDRLGAVVPATDTIEPPPELPSAHNAETERSAALAAGVLLPDGSPGPNAATREAAMAAARRQAEAAAREGHFGADLALVETSGPLGPDGSTAEDVEPLVDDAQGTTVLPVSTEPSTVADDALDGMNVEALLAHLNQHPADADRVESANARRKHASKQVADALAAVRQAVAEREDDAALARRDAGASAPTE